MFVNVAFLVVGENLDPASVTEYLQIQPTRAQKKGDIRPGINKKSFTAKHGSWAYSLELENGDWQGVNIVVGELAKKIGEHIKCMPSFSGATNTWVDILIQIGGDEKSDGAANFRLSSETMQILAETKLPVEFTIYINDDAD